MSPATVKEPHKVGALVERIASPRETLVKDGLIGTVTQVLPASEGEYGYFVRFAAGVPPLFCAGSRLRALNGATKLAHTEHISTIAQSETGVS